MARRVQKRFDAANWLELVGAVSLDQLSVSDGRRSVPLSGVSATGFAVEETPEAPLRGRIWILQGDEPVWTALAELETVVAGAAHYRFKRHAPLRTAPPLNFVANDSSVVFASIG